MCSIVAFLAHERWASLEQRRNVGTMRRMAAHAIFCGRLMFKQERTALLGVATPASFINGILAQQLGSCRTMQVMATGTSHLACIERVRRYFVGFGTLLFMAGEAHCFLGLLVGHLVVRCMDLVA